MMPVSWLVEALVAVVVTVITIICVLLHRFRRNANISSDAKHIAESGHRPDGGIPKSLTRHAENCNRIIYEVQRDENSLFSSLADQLRVYNAHSAFTGQSLRDAIEAVVEQSAPLGSPAPSEQNRRQIDSNCNPRVQEAANYLRRRIFLYRDDDNPPFFIQPSGHHSDETLQELYIGSINNAYYVSLRPRDYTQGQVDAAPEEGSDPEDDKNVADAKDDTGSEDDSDIEMSLRSFVQVGDNSELTAVISSDEGRANVRMMTIGTNNRATVVVTVPQETMQYTQRMVNSGVTGDVNCTNLKINITGISPDVVERAENAMISYEHELREDINATITHTGVELVYLGPGCIRMSFKVDTWQTCLDFISGLYHFNDKYICIFQHIINVIKTINDSTDVVIDVKVDIGDTCEGIASDDSNKQENEATSECLIDEKLCHSQPSGNESQGIEGKDPKPDSPSGHPSGTLSIHAMFKPTGGKFSMEPINYEDVGVTTARKVLEFRGGDFSYTPHSSLVGRRSKKSKKLISSEMFGVPKLRFTTDKILRSEMFGVPKLRSTTDKILQYYLKKKLRKMQTSPMFTNEDLDKLKSRVFAIRCENRLLGTGFKLKKSYLLTAGHVIDSYGVKPLCASQGATNFAAAPVGIFTDDDVGVLRLSDKGEHRSLDIDFEEDVCTQIFVVGYVDGKQTPQVEQCRVSTSQDAATFYIRFQSKLFSEGSSGSPCLVFKNGRFLVKGILIGRMDGDDESSDLLAVTLSSVCRRLGVADF